MRQCSRLIAAASALLAATAVNASPIRYEFTSDLAPLAPNSGTNFGGFVEFDDSLLVANTTINVASFTNWAFSWGNDFDYVKGSSFFAPTFDIFRLGASLQVSESILCFSATAICDTGQHPVALVLTDRAFATYNTVGDQVGALGAWSGPTKVSEPSTIALFALALLGLGLRRRSRA